MSDKETKAKGKEETKTEGCQSFTEVCCATTSSKTPKCCCTETQGTESGKTPDRCGPEMRSMMARMVAGFEAQQEKETEAETDGGE